MPTLVSTGQITIVDNNDARPITAYITASGQTQQVYAKDDTTESFNPNWTSAPLTLTAAVYVGGTSSATNVVNLASFSNKKWSNDLSTSIGANSTLVVNTNLTEANPSKIYYFEGDYTDPITNLVSHIIAQITLSLVKTGTNATYVIVTGQNAIIESDSSTKNTVMLTANLLRGSTIDDTDTVYKWYISPFAAADQLDANHALVVSGAISFKNTAGATATSPVDGTFADVKSIVIREDAVTDIAYFKVEVQSGDANTYATYFTVYDVSDPYDLTLISTSGDKLQNGVGSTYVYPIVYNGSTQLTDTTGWTFDYELYDVSGSKVAFVDPAVATRTISSNTTGAFVVNTAITLSVNSVIKVVSTSGTIRYYETEAVSNSTTINIDLTPDTQTFASSTTPTANQFSGGNLFVCQGTNGVVSKTGGTLANTQNGTHYTNSRITVTGDDIDTKGTITCKANRP